MEGGAVAEDCFAGFSGVSKTLLCFAALAVAHVPVTAAEGFQLGGFGTLGHVADNRPDMAVARDISQFPKNGYATGANWRVDSRLGVQVEYGVSPTIDLVGQFVLRDQFKAGPDSATELAYVAFRPTSELDIRVGRINYDAFLMADYRNVGYAYTWVRPPVEFYGWIPIFSVNGVDAGYAFHSDEARWRLKIQAGQSDFQVPMGSGTHFRTKDLFGASLTRQAGSWRLKAAYSQFRVGNDVPSLAPLLDGLDSVAAMAPAAIGGEAADLRRNLSFKGARVTYSTVGAVYDDGVWLAQAEAGYTTSTAAILPHGRMAYASLGRRFGEWTPFLMASTSRPGNNLRTAANNWGGYNGPLRDPALFTMNSTRMEQATFSLGTRWDFSQRAALKVQWDNSKVKPSGYGLWWRDLGLNDQSSRVHQLSATLDFVF